MGGRSWDKHKIVCDEGQDLEIATRGTYETFNWLRLIDKEETFCDEGWRCNKGRYAIVCAKVGNGKRLGCEEHNLSCQNDKIFESIMMSYMDRQWWCWCGYCKRLQLSGREKLLNETTTYTSTQTKKKISQLQNCPWFSISDIMMLILVNNFT